MLTKVLQRAIDRGEIVELFVHRDDFDKFELVAPVAMGSELLLSYDHTTAGVVDGLVVHPLEEILAVGRGTRYIADRVERSVGRDPVSPELTKALGSWESLAQALIAGKEIVTLDYGDTWLIGQLVRADSEWLEVRPYKLSKREFDGEMLVRWRDVETLQFGSRDEQTVAAAILGL